MRRIDTRPRRLIPGALAGGLAAIILAASGCGGGGGSNESSGTTQPAQRGVRITVVDGDTRVPLTDASVLAYDETGGQLGSAVPVDTAGRATLPEGTALAVASSSGHTQDSRTILPGRREVTIPLFDPALQSPEYGALPTRTRYVPGLDLPPPSGPPAWTYRRKALLEFPPSVARGTVVLTTNRGKVIAFNAATGGIRWQRRHTTTSYIASSPAIMSPERLAIVSGMDGRVVAYDLQTGRTKWEFSAGTSSVESSPLVIGETAIFGAWNGRLYAISTRTGRLRWSYQAAAAIKGSAAQSGDNVIFGDYAGNLYAVRVADGGLVWKTAAGRRFYGGPGVSNGIAVIGDVGGAVVGVDATTGRRIWRHPTGGTYVYGSPAIARGTVFIGSYNGHFEALNLRTGRVRWSFPAGGRISGSATVVGHTVYTAVLARPGQPDRTYGLDTATGAVRWRGNDGRYSPAVAAGRTLYIVGRTTLYAYPAP